MAIHKVYYGFDKTLQKVHRFEDQKERDNWVGAGEPARVWLTWDEARKLLPRKQLWRPCSTGGQICMIQEKVATPALVPRS